MSLRYELAWNGTYKILYDKAKKHHQEEYEQDILQ